MLFLISTSCGYETNRTRRVPQSARSVGARTAGNPAPNHRALRATASTAHLPRPGEDTHRPPNVRARYFSRPCICLGVAPHYKRKTSFIFLMDNLFASICASYFQQKKGHRIPVIVRVKHSGFYFTRQGGSFAVKYTGCPIYFSLFPL